MASTEPDPPAPIEALTTADLAGALRLSEAAQWNQNEADWRGMLALGQGWAIHAPEASGAAQLAASTVVLPYGAFAWISMVLVLPEFRRRGYATQLLRHALAHLAAQSLTAVLDATPVGRAVYAKEGLCDTWGFARYRREPRAAAPASAASPAVTRPVRDSDWPAIAALDAPAFGADRQALLRSLAARLPGAARVLEAKNGRLRGFVFGREGREASQIGPLLADDMASAQNLLHDVLGTMTGPVFIDLLDRCTALMPWLEQQGFSVQRPFTRMVRGALSAPGDPSKIVLVAGPELG
ncbi:MAG: GNAT family N-acetyltransferase [Burkholderiaceae bacterium]